MHSFYCLSDDGFLFLATSKSNLQMKNFIIAEVACKGIKGGTFKRIQQIVKMLLKERIYDPNSQLKWQLLLSGAYYF